MHRLITSLKFVYTKCDNFRSFIMRGQQDNFRSFIMRGQAVTNY